VRVAPGRYGSALGSAVRGTSLRQLARRPLERQAEQLINACPAVDLSELTGEVSFTARVPAPERRHAWSLHAPDLLLLQALIAGRGVRTAFEIGTFNGGTTRAIAEALPADGQVWTLDLPPAEFDHTQGPDAFRGSDVGRAYGGSAAESKITQLLHDSMTFDATPYASACDLVLVDGAHDYEHGANDTRLALSMVAPGGIILWDDFTAYWHGLISGIIEAAGPRRPRRLAGSNLGVWTSDIAPA
jgi:predicted O-methyltransferase YrrM